MQKRKSLSYTFMGSEKPLIGMTVGDLFDDIVERYPDREALVSAHQGVRYTWRELQTQVNRAAKGLLSLGYKKGDRVAIWGTNVAEWVITQWATAKAGIIMININPAYRTHELEYVLKQSEVQGLLLIDSFKTSNYVKMFNEVCPEAKDSKPGKINSENLPFLKSVVLIRGDKLDYMYSWDEMLRLGDD